MEFISKKLSGMVQERIAVEQNSAQLYLAIAQWCDFIGWMGAAKLFNKYSEEESGHAKKVCGYLLDVDVMPIIPCVDKPSVSVSGLKDIVELALEHEVTVTDSYKDLASAAMNESDFVLYGFAQQMVNEQLEETSKFINWRDRLTVVPDWKVDEEMGA